MLVDTHAHIYKEYYEDIDAIIENSKKCEINFIINAGIDQKTNEEVLLMSTKYNNMYVTLGIHPESVEDYCEDDLIFIEKNCTNPKVIAIGEIGLDYHYENYNKEKQIKLFQKQLALAEKYCLPVVIHSRDATQDTIDVLKAYKLKGVIHSFSGSKEIAKIFIDMGYKLGINGVVTFKNAHIKDVIKELGINHFVLETDSPYLTPVPLRGKQNFPGNITYIADFLCKYLNITEENLSKITNENIASIFDKFKY